MLDFLYAPEMPKVLPALMALSVLIWVVFIVYFAYTSRTVGPFAAFNRVATFIVTIALCVTVVTTIVWDWGVRQASERISTSAGWALLDAASGGTTKLGEAAEANRMSILDSAPQFAGASAASNSLSGGGQQQVVVDPTPQSTIQQMVQTVGQPSDVEFGQKTLKGVGEVYAWRATLQGSEWVFDHLVLIDGSVVTAPKDLPAKIPLPPTSIPATTVVQPQPTPMPEQLAPTPPTVVRSEEEILKQQVACFLQWAEDNNFSSFVGKQGAGLLPFGLQFQLTGPGGWLDFGSWIWESAERWLLSILNAGIDLPVTGSWARSIPGADDSSTIIVNGRGMFCQPQP